MSWNEIAILISSIASIVAILVSVYAVYKSQQASEINTIRENNNDLINALFELQKCTDKEISTAMLYRVETVFTQFKLVGIEKDTGFNNFKVFIGDILKDFTAPYLRIIGHLNALCNSSNEKYIDKCGDLLNNLNLSNNDFYRAIEEYIDALLEVHAINGSYIALKPIAINLVEKLCELRFAERAYKEFLTIFVTSMRRQSENLKYFKVNKKLFGTKLFTDVCEKLEALGFMEKNEKVMSPSLENALGNIAFLRKTRTQNLILSLKLYDKQKHTKKK